jgi:hypothetical protein
VVPLSMCGPGCWLLTQSCTRPSQVVQRIKAVEGQTQLLVVDKETDEELRRRQLTCTEEMAQRGLPPINEPWELKPDWAHVGSLNSDTGQKVWWVLPIGPPWPSPGPSSWCLDDSLCLWPPPQASISSSSWDPFPTHSDHTLDHLWSLFLP